MYPAHRVTVIALLLMIQSLAGCGGLQEMWAGPGADSFHPKSIAVLPPLVGQYEGARDLAGDVLVTALAEKKSFQKIVPMEQVRTVFQEKEAGEILTSYYAKFEATGQSDREMAVKLGKLLEADALLLAKVNVWEYTRSEGDNLAKVSLGLRLVDGAQGGLVWKARQERTKSYMFLKPDLRDLAEDVAEDMVKYLPR